MCSDEGLGDSALDDGGELTALKAGEQLRSNLQLTSVPEGPWTGIRISCDPDFASSHLAKSPQRRWSDVKW